MICLIDERVSRLGGTDRVSKPNLRVVLSGLHVRKSKRAKDDSIKSCGTLAWAMRCIPLQWQLAQVFNDNLSS